MRRISPATSLCLPSSSWRSRRAFPPHMLPPRWLGVTLLTLTALGAAGPATALEPPQDPYFQSRGTWDQDWDDQ